MVLSQNHKKDILSVCKFYNSLTNYSMNLKYKLFLDGNTTKPYQTREVQIKRMGKNVFMHHNSDMDIIDNENYQIIVNNKTKIFSARKKDPEENADIDRNELNSFLETNMDSLMLTYEKIKTLEENADRVKYELIYRNNDQIDKTVLVINKTKHVYESMTVYYKAPVKVKQLDGKKHLVTLQVVYDDFQLNSVSNKNIFSEKNYITLDKKNNIVPLKKYSDYKLIIPNE
jgi:hypothetical protein